MNLSELYKKIELYKAKREKLKNATTYKQSFRELPMPESGRKTVPFMVLSDWFDVPDSMAVDIMIVVEENLRVECKRLAEELGIEHEELPLDE